MAVFTPVSSADLEPFLARYPLGAAERLEPIMEGIENTNYHLFTSQGRYILTLYERRTAPEALPFILAFMAHLHARGIPCPSIVPDRTGATIVTLLGRPTTIQTFLEGHGLSAGTMTAAQCRNMGVMTARMHQAASGFRMERPNPMGPSAWAALFDKTRARAAEVSPGLDAEIAEHLHAVKALEGASLATGTVHADLFPDNVFFDKGIVSGVIDFGFCCTERLAYDLAIVINAWCFDAGYAFVPENFRALIQGYSSLRRLPDAERDALPLLCRAAALRILMTRLHDWLYHPGDGYVTPKKPVEYLEKLRFHTACNLFDVETV